MKPYIIIECPGTNNNTVIFIDKIESFGSYSDKQSTLITMMSGDVHTAMGSYNSIFVQIERALKGVGNFE